MTRAFDLLQPVKLPDMEKDGVRITNFEITEKKADAFNFGLMMSGDYQRRIAPGRYTRLHIDGELMMSDTPAERRDHLEFIMEARGDVLITGLGIGMASNAAARKSCVNSVTVIEKNATLIELVAPFAHEKVRVVHADALEYRPRPGERYDCVWHDIWPSISTDNGPEITILKKRWARRCSWQSVWGWHEITRMKREDRKDRWRW